MGRSGGRLWAPWRLAYIKSPKLRGCFLCRYARARDDRRNLVVRRGDTCLCTINLFPYNNGHLMVAPRRHVGRIDRLAPAEWSELWAMTREMVLLIEKKLRPHGFNVGLNLGRPAGAGLPGHLHVHIVPRWSGDTNFMPVLGDTKILPMSLEALYDLLQGSA